MAESDGHRIRSAKATDGDGWTAWSDDGHGTVGHERHGEQQIDARLLTLRALEADGFCVVEARPR